MLLTKVISTVPRALLRPISKQRCRRRKGPRWSVRRALPQAIGSLIHPDLSCGAVSLPEDLTPRRLSSPCYGRLTGSSRAKDFCGDSIVGCANRRSHAARSPEKACDVLEASRGSICTNNGESRRVAWDQQAQSSTTQPLAFYKS